MDPIELNERPTVARRRLSQTLLAGPDDNKRRGSLISLVKTSADDPPAVDAAGVDGKEGSPARRVSVKPRRASALSRVLALSTTSQSFQDEKITPYVITAMLFLDNPNPDVYTLRQVLGERLLDIPRFRSVVKADEKGGVIFEPLARSDVDLEEHITHMDGKHMFGNSEDINGLINDAYKVWDASMPLWSIKIVTNLKDGRSLLFVAIDHAVGDGVSLLSVFLSLFDDNDDHDDDTAPVGSTPVLQKERKTPKGLSLSHRAIAVLKGIRAGTVDTLVPPPSDKQNSLMVPKDKLTAPGFGKDFAQTRAFPIEEMKLMKGKMEGVTMNDMIMAILTMTVRRYLEQKGDTEGLNLVKRGKGTIRAVFPVNMRSGVVNKANVGNDFCLGYLPFGMDYKDSVDSVWKTKTLVDELKMSPAFALAKKVNDVVMPISPDWMLAKLLLDVNNRTTCMISNVVGPETSASIGGNTINDLNFTTAFGNSLYFGVLSFAGKLRISAVLDQKTGSDVVDLIKCCEDSYDELKAVLDNVHEDDFLKRPDMTPLSAKLLELLVVAAVIALPVFVASKMF